jgi:ubiquinone/menaquinone biosynthesis C-methylase UbiE
MHWSSYDRIAGQYDDVWGSRFDAVARLLWDAVPVPPRASALDVGTGTAAVLRALVARHPEAAPPTGCDRSSAMLHVARARVPEGRFLLADARRLPFADGSFDVGTASFVLSHLPDHEAGLAEVKRVLRPGGTFAMTSWAVDTDVHVAAWRELLTEVVSAEFLRGAVDEVTPREALFDHATGVESALSAAGFVGVQVEGHTHENSYPLDHFLRDREMGAAGRCARNALGDTAWRAFLERARERLGARFGPVVRVARGILIGLGRCPG